jgi:hypothetical protein
MGQIRLRRGFHRLNEIAATGFSRRSAGLIERQSALYLLAFGGFGSVDGLKGRENDPNCGLRYCRLSLGPLGLHEPL